jgi:hypothetical protein
MMSDDSDDIFILMPEVAEMPLDELRKYALERAETIARATSGDDGASWDDPEEWQDAAAELAHAFIRLQSAAATTYEEGMATRWESGRGPR